MKKLEVIIGSDVADQICHSLFEAGASDIIATETKGIDDRAAIKEIYRGRVYEIDFVPKTKLEVIVPDALVVPVVSAIIEGGFAERTGGGKILVSSVEKIIQVETHEIESELVRWLQ